MIVKGMFDPEKIERDIRIVDLDEDRSVKVAQTTDGLFGVIFKNGEAETQIALSEEAAWALMECLFSLFGEEK